MNFRHNHIEDPQIRIREEDFNLKFIQNLGLSKDLRKFEGTRPVFDEGDSTPYMTVWLQNIDRLMNLLPPRLDLGKYHLCDVGCGIGISTLYFAKKYKLKSFGGFDYNGELIHQANQIKNQLCLDVKLSFETANAKEKKIEEKPHILFMFNPFGKKTLKQFIENNKENLIKTRSIILYANDLWINEIEEGTVVNRDHFFNLSCLEF